MTKITEYRQTLKNLEDWTPFLMKESGLPGPRGNLELAQAVAQEGDGRQFEKLLSFSAEAKENSPQVFLVFCGVVGLGKLAAQGKREIFARLRSYASDPRWRVREAVAMGLQLAGDENMSILLTEMQSWRKGNWYEKRAVAAALSEPRLLKDPHNASQVLQILDQITASMQTTDDPKDEAFKVLRQAMGYCWSVAAASLPKVGRSMMEKWLTSQNKDIHWVMKENLKKKRLVKMDPQWVKVCQSKLALL